MKGPVSEYKVEIKYIIEEDSQYQCLVSVYALTGRHKLFLWDPRNGYKRDFFFPLQIFLFYFIFFRFFI